MTTNNSAQSGATGVQTNAAAFGSPAASSSAATTAEVKKSECEVDLADPVVHKSDCPIQARIIDELNVKKDITLRSGLDRLSSDYSRAEKSRLICRTIDRATADIRIAVAVYFFICVPAALLLSDYWCRIDSDCCRRIAAIAILSCLVVLFIPGCAYVWKSFANMISLLDESDKSVPQYRYARWMYMVMMIACLPAFVSMLH